MTSWLQWLLLIPALFCGHFLHGQNPQVSFQLGHHTGVHHLTSNSRFTSLYSADDEGNIIHWDINSGRQVRMLASQSEKVNGLLLVEEQKRLVAVYERTVRIWDLEKGKVLHTQNFNEKSMLKEALVFRSGYLIAGVHEMYICDSSLQVQKTFRYDAIFEKGKAPEVSEKKIVVSVRDDDATNSSIDLMGGIFISEDEKEITYAIFEGQYLFKYRGIYTIDSETFEVKKHYWHFDAFTFVVTPDHSALFRLNLVKKCIVRKSRWPQAPKGEVVSYAPSKPGNPITAYTAGNRFFYMGDASGTVVVSGTNDNRHRFVLNGHDAAVSKVHFSADEKYLVTADEKGLILLWSMLDGKLVRAFTGHAHAINSILYNSNGDQLVLGFGNGEVKVWNLFSNEQKKLNLRSMKGKDMDWAVLTIDAFKNDSVVDFRCSAKDEKNTFIYDVTWNIFSNAILLTEFALNEKNAEKRRADTIQLNNGQRLSFSENDILILGEDSAFTKMPSGHAAGVSDMAYNARYDFYTTSGLDGVLRTFKTGSDTALFTSGCLGERGFFHVLPQGYYFADKSSLKSLAFRLGEKVYPFEQFDVQFNRPDLVVKNFPFTDSIMVMGFEKAWEKRKKRTAGQKKDWHPETAPEIKIITSTMTASGSEYEFKIEAHAQGPGISRLYVDVNGVPELSLTVKPVNDYSYDCKVKLNDGMNRITAYAENEESVQSLKQEIVVKNMAKHEKPVLYLVAIGSGQFTDTSMNLAYAGKDAEDIAELFGKEKSYRSVVKKLYTGKQVDPAIVGEIKNTLQQASVNDLVVVFYAGHGLLDKKFNYYLSSAQTDFDHPEQGSIPYTELENLVAQCPSRKKLLLLDACHSGEVDKESMGDGKSGLKVYVGDIKFRGGEVFEEMGSNQAFEFSKALFADVDRTMGASIISSASGAELAVEGDEWNNGLFTHVVLSGLRSKKADLNHDKHVQVSELLFYVNEQVKTLTKGRQNPNGRAENIYYDFTVW